ncbi:MAG: alpha/beta hydrolase family protein [Planctomycetaceae bacterium]
MSLQPWNYRVTSVLAMAFLLATASQLPAQTRDTPVEGPVIDTSRGDRMIDDYFQRETAQLTENCFAEIHSAEDWNSRRPEYLRQLREMLGLDPLPEKTPLDVQITGKVDHPEFTVENLSYQAMPGLYVTGNLYLPKDAPGPLPAVLYVCGHAKVVKDGVSYGGKAHYQHHASWFARNGYVCLVIDTIELGELEGEHHGTYNERMWWWNSRGYTPAGVEAWNGIRALDLLQSRPEVDGERLGITGRSGGGAYSWWVAALDDRIKVAVPVAGITSLHNHVVGGCVEGHCDCMYHVNTYRWDFPMIAAMVAPRALLISNTDKDGIFPLDGVVDVYQKTRKIYELLGAGPQVGLQIAEGPHHDVQELQVHAFHWFDRLLKEDPAYKNGETRPQIEKTAAKLFEIEQLKVFAVLPSDQRTTTIHDSFVPQAEIPAIPENQSAYAELKNEKLQLLKDKVFRGWPTELEGDVSSLNLTQVFSATSNDVTLTAYDFSPQEPIRLRLYLAHRAGLVREELELVVLNVLDDQGWEKFLSTMRPGFADQFTAEQAAEPNHADFAESQKMFTNFKWGMAYVAPRGIGPTKWNQLPFKQSQHRRRFMLLGQTLAGMQVWDVRRALLAVRHVPGMSGVPHWVQGEREQATVGLYATLFEPSVVRADLWDLSATHAEGPDFLNVLRVLDLPVAVAFAGEHAKIRIYNSEASQWEFPMTVAKKLGWDAKQIQIRSIAPTE